MPDVLFFYFLEVIIYVYLIVNEDWLDNYSVNG